MPAGAVRMHLTLVMVIVMIEAPSRLNAMLADWQMRCSYEISSDDA
jgi:hypothetical protein